MSTRLKAPAAINRGIFIMVLLLFIVPFFSGCSPFSTIAKTTRKITRDITGSGGKLKKKVGIAVFANKTAFETSEFKFQRKFYEKLSQACSNTLFVKPGDRPRPRPGLPAKLPESASGAVDHFLLAQSGRELGFNAIVSGSLLTIKTASTQKGFMWFKTPQPMIQVDMAVEVFDIETGSKLLDERFAAEVEVQEAEFELSDVNKPNYSPAIQRALLRIINSMGKKVCDTLAEQPWKGYIVSIIGDKVIISSGRDTGLVPGDILEVFDSGGTIKGSGNQTYFLPGLKSGEIKITNVFLNRSEAAILSGKRPKKNGTVKFKR